MSQVCELKTGVAGTSITWAGLAVSMTTVNEYLQAASLLLSVIVGCLTVAVLVRKLKAPPRV